MKSAINTIKALSVVCALCFTFNTQAQSLDEARAMINNKDYEAASAAFSHLINKYKTRADVNKWYGEALFETGHFTQAEPYLKYAANRRVSSAYPYLAKIEYLSYNFDKAIEYYKLYLRSLKKGSDDYLATEKAIEKINTNKRSINSVEKVILIDSIVVDKANFFEKYNLGPEAGQILGNVLSGNPDVAVEETSFFESQRKDKRLFSIINNKGNLDIAESSKLLGDNWSNPDPLPEQINTPYNEAFPYMLTDGSTIYYASDNPEGLGGYDLYITRYNPTTGNFFRPERLSMPFNSPYNDYMMAIDEINQVGWFASDRFQPKDKIVIYLFVVNSGNKEYYEGLEDKQLIKLAKISSIKETWPEGQDYNKLLNTVYSQQNSKQVKDLDFTFVVNDLIVYHSLSDFECKEAKVQYEMAKSSFDKYEEDSLLLEKLRRQWAEGNKETQKQIKSRILQLENTTLSHKAQAVDHEKNARRLEIDFLRKNQ